MSGWYVYFLVYIIKIDPVYDLFSPKFDPSNFDPIYVPVLVSIFKSTRSLSNCLSPLSIDFLLTSFCDLISILELGFLDFVISRFRHCIAPLFLLNQIVFKRISKVFLWSVVVILFELVGTMYFSDIFIRDRQIFLLPLQSIISIFSDFPVKKSFVPCNYKIIFFLKKTSIIGL